MWHLLLRQHCPNWSRWTGVPIHGDLDEGWVVQKLSLYFTLIKLWFSNIKMIITEKGNVLSKYYN